MKQNELGLEVEKMKIEITVLQHKVEMLMQCANIDTQTMKAQLATIETLSKLHDLNSARIKTLEDARETPEDDRWRSGWRPEDQDDDTGLTGGLN